MLINVFGIFLTIYFDKLLASAYTSQTSFAVRICVVAPPRECFRVKADMVLFAGNTVWSISEHVRGVCEDVLYKSTLPLHLQQWCVENKNFGIWKKNQVSAFGIFWCSLQPRKSRIFVIHLWITNRVKKTCQAPLLKTSKYWVYSNFWLHFFSLVAYCANYWFYATDA